LEVKEGEREAHEQRIDKSIKSVRLTNYR